MGERTGDFSSRLVTPAYSNVRRQCFRAQPSQCWYCMWYRVAPRPRRMTVEAKLEESVHSATREDLVLL